MSTDPVARNVDVDEERRPLRELSRTNPETIPIAKTLGIGIVSLLIGLLFARAAGSPQGMLRSEGAPVTALAVIAATFLLPGAALVTLASCLFRRRRRRTRYVPLPSANAGRAERDFLWTPRGMPDASREELWGFLYGGAYGLFLLVPLQAAFLATRGWGWLFVFAAVVLDICFGVAAVRIVLRRAGTWRFGSVRLRFWRFPLDPGGRFEAELLVPKGLAGVDALRCILRFVTWERETAYQGGSGQAPIEVTVPYQEWAVSWEVPLARRGNPKEIPLAIDLPPSCPETRLSRSPPQYWELEVATDASGRDYRGKFLVPVYSS